MAVDRPEILGMIRGVQQGDPRSEAALLKQFDRFCWKCAQRWHQTLLVEDAVQGARIGLVEAARRFDFDRGVTFLTFASWKIRGAIGAEIRAARAYGEPENLRNSAVAFVGAAAARRNCAFTEAAREPEVLLGLIERLGMEDTAEAREKIGALLATLVPPERDVFDDPEQPGPDHHTHFVETETPEDLVGQGQEVAWARDRVEGLLAKLPKRAQAIIDARWLQPEPVPYQTLAVRWGISKQAVQQAEGVALEQLKKWSTQTAAQPPPNPTRSPRPEPKLVPSGRFKPRQHQRRALADILAGFSMNKRGQFISACGTGKTFTALWLRERLDAQRTVVFVPSLALLSQTLFAWAAQASRAYVSIAVCSDLAGSGSESGSSSEAQAALLDGLRPTTNPRVLAVELQACKGPVVVFATYQSSAVVEAAGREASITFDLMLLDEAHRTAGSGLTDFTRPLFDERIPASRRLAMTATPRLFKSTGSTGSEDDLVAFASMDDLELYGPVFHELTFPEAIAQGLLAPLQIAVVAVPNDVDFDSHALALAATSRAIQQYGCRRLISYHSRIAYAQKFAAQLPKTAKHLGVTVDFAESIDGTMPLAARNAGLQNLIGEDAGVVLISNAQCLIEGVNIPKVDGIVFAEPRSSAEVIAQAVGRALRRTGEPDEVSTVILPVQLPESEDAGALDDTAFRMAWRVLIALQGHDLALQETLNEARYRLGRAGSIAAADLPGVILDFPVEVPAAFLEAVRLRLVRHSSSRWEEALGALERFVQENGHTSVPAKYVTPQGLRLGSWCFQVRQEYREGRLSAAWIQRIGAVPNWWWVARQFRFEQGIAALHQFVQQHGHAFPPRKYTTSEGFRLGTWVQTRREEYRCGTLPPAEQEVLETIPAWVWEGANVKAFDQAVQHATTYLAEHAWIPIRATVGEERFNLGGWANKQRQRYRLGALSAERTAALQAIPGWSWSSPDEARFEAHLQALHLFLQAHDRYPTRQDQFQGLRVGAWVHSQRIMRTAARVPDLEAIPGWTWNTFEAAFTARLQEYRALIERTDTSLGYAPIHAWASTQRAQYRQGKLQPDQIAALEALPGWDWERKKLPPLPVEAALPLLRDYVEEHGRLPGKNQTVAGVRLGAWINNRQTAYRRGVLKPRDIALLEAIPGWCWSRRAARPKDRTTTEPGE